jgi:hypothetical protein
VYFKDMIVGNPQHWDFIPEVISSLKHKQWISAQLMDHVLFHEWLHIRSPAVHWIPFWVSRLLQAGTMSTFEHQNVRSQLNLSATGSLEQKHVVVGVWASSHYFVAYFDYQRQHIHVLGRLFKAACYQNDKWDDWGGPILWTRIASFLGWGDASPVGVTTSGLSWKQVGVSMYFTCHIL